MNIQDYLQYLVDVDLHNLHLKDEETGLVKGEHYRRLLTLIKSGIKELSTRFHLVEEVSKAYELHKGTHQLDLKKDIDTHDWIKDIIQISDVYVAGIKYPDGVMNYLPDIHRVNRISREETLVRMERNDASACNYFLSNNTTINIYTPYPFAVFKVVCRVAKGAISELRLEDELPLPVAYHNALSLYIASRMYRSMDNQLDGDVNESMRYFQAYQHELQMLSQQGIELDRQPQDNLFNQRGFV